MSPALSCALRAAVIYVRVALITALVSSSSLAAAINPSTSSAEGDTFPFAVPQNIAELPETALIETNKGPFEIKFYRKEAPISVANFEYLGRKGYYDNVPFNRYQPGFVIQGGDPTGTRKGGPGWTLPPELNSSVRHTKGTLGWARLADPVNPHRRSNGSQFYITLSPNDSLDGFYTIFARVVAGMENVEQLREGDKIIKVKFPKTAKRVANGESWSAAP